MVLQRILRDVTASTLCTPGSSPDRVSMGKDLCRGVQPVRSLCGLLSGSMSRVHREELCMSFRGGCPAVYQVCERVRVLDLGGPAAEAASTSRRWP